jgi:hypothetical protein
LNKAQFVFSFENGLGFPESGEGVMDAFPLRYVGFELFTEKELGPYGEFSILSGLTPFQIMIILLFIKGEPA